MSAVVVFGWHSRCLRSDCLDPKSDLNPKTLTVNGSRDAYGGSFRRGEVFGDGYPSSEQANVWTARENVARAVISGVN